MASMIFSFFPSEESDFTSIQQVAALWATTPAQPWLADFDESDKADMLVCITRDCSFLEFH